MVDYVVGFMFSEDRKDVALVSKNRPKWQAGKVNGVGGKAEDIDDTIKHTMSREFVEETGVSSNPEDWTAFCILENKGLCHVHFFFAISDDVYKSKTIEDEEVAIYPVDNLPENVILNLHWLIKMALDENLVFVEPAHFVEERKVSKDYEDRCNK